MDLDAIKMKVDLPKDFIKVILLLGINIKLAIWAVIIFALNYSI